MSNQSQWKTSTGFILASAGSAIGLGAMWKFPYMAGIYGGGAFLFLFLIFTIFVGLPLLIMEFTVGIMGRTYTTRIYSKLTGKKWLNIIGWNGNLAVFILFGFYSVIGGWIVIYIGNVFLQLLSVEHTSLTQIKFEKIISNPWLTVLGQGIFILLTMIIVMLGVEKGLEKASKMMMPLLFVFLIIVVAKSLTLDGALEGVRYILQPRIEDISVKGVLFALGQSFFTLSLGTTGMITYASYAPKEMTIKSSAISIVIMNILVSVLAGLAIFPALKTFGYAPQEGPGLLFKVLPLVFNQMGFGIVFYLIFLILFLFAALTSSISLLELNVSNFTKNDNTKRKAISVIASILVFIISIPATLSFSSLSGIKFGAGTIFDNMDFIVSNILMPLGALGTTLVVGQLLDKQALKESFGKDKFKLFVPWYILIKYMMPIIIILVFIVQLF
ncbi:MULTISPECIES: sodium-dependent transporter [Staphylococcus]|uniref:Transporter n=3 Tax=Staphylococcus hominis TaxID=1290 RepID=A0A3S7GUI5_STAHO|nr:MULTISPECIES: sodium-dependent transporter [Staphylococcus]EUZ68160.1 sodium-dependent transporter [Staphylococcus sp. M0480]MDU0844096.1 sodium-dependent transporter [Staphylococcus sp.]OFM78227.1 sodium-dependent transporter [Staphylococcus sp. HMSC074B09]OFM91501.1 sodium-dependent transporter [Staphylococcus sp. HMSC078D05]OFR34545.1 sodium-dependent transporter [Staphylococcus sp. HMSC063F02]OFS51103.1 sodium-dependent transporter [Staphylococcus sp. HMSC075H09]